MMLLTSLPERVINSVRGEVSAFERQAHRAMIRVICQRYQASRRAGVHGVTNTLTLAEWKAILNASRGSCHYCKAIVGVDILTVEHVVPMSAGGPNSACNVVAACKSCNSRQKKGVRRKAA